MKREVRAQKLVAPKTLTAAATLESDVVYIAEPEFDIVTNATVRAGLVSVLSVVVADDALLTNAVEITDLERFIKNNPKSAIDAIAQTAITTANSGNTTRVGFVSPYAGKCYVKVKYAVTGASVSMDIFSAALVESVNYPVIQ